MKKRLPMDTLLARPGNSSLWCLKEEGNLEEYEPLKLNNAHPPLSKTNQHHPSTKENITKHNSLDGNKSRRSTPDVERLDTTWLRIQPCQLQFARLEGCCNWAISNSPSAPPSRCPPPCPFHALRIRAALPINRRFLVKTGLDSVLGGYSDGSGETALNTAWWVLFHSFVDGLLYMIPLKWTSEDWSY